MNRKEREAIHRANLIMQVRSGTKTASDAAKELGISRKTYYQWEKRALSGMLHSLEQGKPGRPKKVIDQEKKAQALKIQELEKELALTRMRLEVHKIFNEETKELPKKKR